MADDPILEKYFKGHHKAVTSVAFAPDGKYVSGSEDGTVKVWTSKKPVRSYTLCSRRSRVMSVAFSPNCSLVASTSVDGVVELAKTELNCDTKSFKSHLHPVRCVDFDPTGDSLATGSDDKFVKVWRVERHRFHFSLKGHKNWIRDVKFMPDGKGLCSASDDKTVKIWDATSRVSTATFYGHSGPVNHVAVHPSNLYVASGGSDSTVRLWDLRFGRPLQLYDEHASPVRWVSFQPNGPYLISCSDDKTVKIYDITEGRIAYTLHGHDIPVNAAEISPSGDIIVSGDGRGQIFHWRTNFPAIPKPLNVLDLVRNVELSDARKPRFLDDEVESEYLYEQSFELSPCNADSIAPRYAEDQRSGVDQRQNQNENTNSNFLSGVTDTLSEILSQLEMLTQTVAIMESRLSATEDKLSALVLQQIEGPSKPTGLEECLEVVSTAPGRTQECHRGRESENTGPNETGCESGRQSEAKIDRSDDQFGNGLENFQSNFLLKNESHGGYLQVEFTGNGNSNNEEVSELADEGEESSKKHRLAIDELYS